MSDVQEAPIGTAARLAEIREELAFLGYVIVRKSRIIELTYTTHVDAYVIDRIRGFDESCRRGLRQSAAKGVGFIALERSGIAFTDRIDDRGEKRLEARLTIIAPRE